MKLSYEDLEEMAGREKKNLGTGQFWRFNELAEETKGKVIVEIGVSRYGTSTAPLLFVAQQRGGTLYSIDIHDYSNNWSKGQDCWEFIHGSSLDVVETWDKPIDFLLIDSAHMYDTTTMEIYKWVPFVVNGGVVAFHDTHRYTKGVLAPILEFLLQYNNVCAWEFHLIPEKVAGTGYMKKTGRNKSYVCPKCSAELPLLNMTLIVELGYLNKCGSCGHVMQTGREYGE